jgi:hypothetical protein
MWGIDGQRWLLRQLGRFLRPGVFVVGVVGGLYTACQILRAQEVPSAGAWQSDKPLSYVLVASGSLTAVFGALVLYGYSRTLKKTEKDVDLADSCKGAWHLAIRELGVPRADLEKVGVHVWSVRGVRGAQYLVRRATFTLQPRRETRVVWCKGKGAVGIAWASGDALVANVANLAALATDEAAFYAIERGRRYGLQWGEFRKARHYRAILAIPLETRPKHVKGVLSIDLLLDGYADVLDTLSNVDELSRIRDVCEKALG